MEQGAAQAIQQIRDGTKEMEDSLHKTLSLLSQLLESLAMFSPNTALQALDDASAASRSGFIAMTDSLLKRVDQVIQKGEDESQDWDSSAAVHMLFNLRRKLVELRTSLSPS